MELWEEPLLASMCEEHGINLTLAQELLKSQDKVSKCLITQEEHIQNIQRLILEEAAE